MIHVKPADEPSGFDADVRTPGYRALAEMVGKTPTVPRTSGRAFKQRKRSVKRADGTEHHVLVTQEQDLPASEFKDYWTRALEDLMEAYDEVCAYSCFRIHPVTGARSVDHFAPKSQAWNRVYEWDNYRLCSARLNARKNDFGDVLDPFEVEDGWFELEFVGFQVRPAEGLDQATSAKVRDTIKRLGLNDYDFRRSRERDFNLVHEGLVTLEHLDEESPFVAREIRRVAPDHSPSRTRLLAFTLLLVGFAVAAVSSRW